MTSRGGTLAPGDLSSKAAGSGPRDLAARCKAWLSAHGVDVSLGLTLPVLWAIGHSFGGIEGDARIYMGRVLADLDPGGVGRDMMFALDGQSSFSLFRLLARTLAGGLGLGPTVALLAITSLVVWFAAAATLVRTVAPGRAGMLVLAIVCVLPRLYAPWNLLAAGEAMPVPRPLAEAFVLVAMAALCQGRVLLCVAGLGVAVLFHPIMAAPGFGVLLLVLGVRDRRWFAAAGAGATSLVAAAALGLPVASRLMQTFDPAWHQLLLDRNPYLFLRLWPADGIGFVPVQWATIMIGSCWLPPGARRVFRGSIAVAVAGCAVSLLLGDLAADVLVVQAQLWRALWLPAVLAPIAAGLCLVHLPRRGPAGQIALAALALSWVAADTVPLGPVAAAAALAAWYGVPRLPFAVGRPSVVAVWVVCVGLAAISEGAAVTALRAILAGMPAAVDVTWNMVWLLKLPLVPVTLLAYAVWRWPRAVVARLGAPVMLALATLLLLAEWDIRTPAHADADAAVVKPDLVAILTARPGEVLWIDGDDVWYWARRANWNGPTQGGGIVFSRELSMAWQQRAQAMLDAGLATSWLMHPWRDPMPSTAPTLDPQRIDTFCARADAPAWIVASLAAEAQPPASLHARIWSPPLAHWKLYVGAAAVHWRHLDRYAVIPCATGRAGA